MMINIHVLRVLYVCFISFSLCLAAPAIKPSFYTVHTAIGQVSDAHLTATITTLKKTFHAYPLDITISNELSTITSLRSFFSSVKSETQWFFNTTHTLSSFLFSFMSTKFFGISCFTYCCIFYVIYRIYRIVETIASIMPLRNNTLSDTLENGVLKDCYKNYYSLFKIYLVIIQNLNKIGLRRLFLYNSSLEERALMYAHIFTA